MGGCCYWQWSISRKRKCNGGGMVAREIVKIKKIYLQEVSEVWCIPKTCSHTKGIVCPMCGDHPPMDSDKEPVKKKGSTIKDKEKSKRMKGQSSHAAWKSETEMQL